LYKTTRSETQRKHTRAPDPLLVDAPFVAPLTANTFGVVVAVTDTLPNGQPLSCVTWHTSTSSVHGADALAPAPAAPHVYWCMPLCVPDAASSALVAGVSRKMEK
jgi:hypothetical protein